MKKLFYVLIISLSIFSLVGCSTEKNNTNGNTNNQESGLSQTGEIKKSEEEKNIEETDKTEEIKETQETEEIKETQETEEINLRNIHNVTENYPKVKEIVEHLNSNYSFPSKDSIQLRIEQSDSNEYIVFIWYEFSKNATEKQKIEAILYTIKELDSELKLNKSVFYKAQCITKFNPELSSEQFFEKFPRILAKSDISASDTSEKIILNWEKSINGNLEPFDPNDILSSEDSSEPSTVTEQEIPKEQSEVETKIISTTKAEFGEQNYIMVNYIPEDNYVLIKAKGKENLSNEATVKGMYLSISKILKELKDIPDLNIDFNIEYSMIDTSGNLSSMIVIKATYTNATRSNINWDRFLWENMDIIADEWWIHPALQEAWQK